VSPPGTRFAGIFATDQIARSSRGLLDALVAFERTGFGPKSFGDARSREAWIELTKKPPPKGAWSASFSREEMPPFGASFSPRRESKLPVGNIVDIDTGPLDGVHAEQYIELVTALCSVDDPISAYAHDRNDLEATEDPRLEDSLADVVVYDAYWLMVFGNAQVEELGRKRVMATPAHRIVKLPQGGVLVVTMPTPNDVTSPAWRHAEAAVLAHLMPSTTFEAAMARYADRNRMLAPVPRDWDPDLVPVFELIVADLGGVQLQRETAQFSAVRPPPVGEVLAEVRPSDVADVKRTIRKYLDRIEDLIIAIQDETNLDVDAEPEIVPVVDAYFFIQDYPGTFGAEKTARLIEPLGAWLGDMLVTHLDGEWVPRQRTLESQVVVGGRAFLPFQRAHNYFQSRDAVLMHSLSQFFAEAQRAASSR